jgi:hypothetical protein
VSSRLLVHLPLLGPAVLQPLAAALRRRGHAVVVPDVRAAVETAPAGRSAGPPPLRRPGRATAPARPDVVDDAGPVADLLG